MDGFMDGRRIYPLPEIFEGEDGRGWRIRHHAKGAGVDYAARTITAPLDDGAISRCLKLQQIARIKWDDRTIADPADSLLFKAVNDHRLSYLLDAAGIDIDAGFLTEATVLELMGGPAGVLALLLMTDYTGMAPGGVAVQPAIAKEAALFAAVRERVRADPSKRNVLAICKWLRSQIRDRPPPPCAMPRGFRPVGGAGGRPHGEHEYGDLDDYFEEGWEACGEDQKLQNLPAEVREQLPDEMPEGIGERMKHWEAHRKAYPGRRTSFVPWGPASLHEPPRPLAATGKFVRTWKATDEGVFPRYPHRFAVDQRVFARRIKRPGGTVIIDCSGSMSLSSEAIRAMVEHAPGCVVANYSGDYQKGVIRVLAKNGKRVVDDLCCRPSGGGNVIDFPALCWAFKLEHPRIWVSDLGVTGLGDASGPGNFAMCAAVVRKGRFFHGCNAEEAIAILKRLGRFYRRTAD